MSYLMHTGRKGMKWGQHIFGGEDKKTLKRIRKVDNAATMTKKIIKNLDAKTAVKNILNNPGSQQHRLFMQHVNQQNFQNMIDNSIMIANQNLTSFMNMTITTNNMAMNNAMTMHMMHF